MVSVTTKAHHSTSSNSYPFVHDFYEFVPLPFTETHHSRHGSASNCPANSLDLVCRLQGSASSFPTNPIKFTIPGTTKANAEAFVTAMQATVRWNRERRRENVAVSPKPNNTGKSRPRGAPPKFHYKLEFTCPRQRHYEKFANSRKRNQPTIKCDCHACFNVQHHKATNSLQVVWYWQHKHNPYSYEDMLLCRSPEVVEQWLNKKFISGLGWKAIHRLLSSPNIFKVCC
ncbi:hypothetical protein PCANC_04249 [Puccinia coronata f. sp. avenae]|uniref:Uncharacterized protein n=1 Tax=Puccinia coronata f. sp. avenae TaxID=200324 RepID=A0A2N5VX18_9BASI|nr:hypothetical protein PCANC_04249 [Puccinia coronata f. sp. avenae]